MNKKIDIKLIQNNSKKYIIDSIWDSKNFGKFKIVGKVNKSYYLIEFLKDGTQIITQGASIGNGTVKNPYFPLIFNVACIGRISQYHFLYKRWEGMLRRVYYKKSKAYKNYGGRNITIDNELLCFESYVNYISSLENYEKMVDNPKLYEIDRTNNNEGYKIGNLRIVTRIENQRNTRNNHIVRMIKDNIIIDEDIIIRLVEKYKQFDLKNVGISAVINGTQKSHRGFKFEKII